MNHRFFGRAAIAIAATALTSLGVAAPAAQAATAGPRFSCDNYYPALCIFQGSQWSGTAIALSTTLYGDSWVSITNPSGNGPSGITLPWGSFNDDSGSSVAFGDAQTGQIMCYTPGTRLSEPQVRSYRWVWIEFGNTNCTGSLGTLPHP
ncbi:MAG TPA: hypothetical protein VGM14_03250 [Streptosporangiaceae bacterium]|jgi:hypothetical protein